MKLVHSFIFLMLVVGLVCSSQKPPEVCTMPAGMTCQKFYIYGETGYAAITLVNGLQKTIVVTNASCTKQAAQFEPCTSARCLDWVSTNNLVVPLGSSFKLNISCNDENGNPISFYSGDDFSGRINIQYYFLDEGPQNSRKICLVA
ncbi:MAG: hypothetical protein V1909_01045 [Candidatus Micrarchaeota archaeon]